jgi:hypothetical protein
LKEKDFTLLHGARTEPWDRPSLDCSPARVRSSASPTRPRCISSGKERCPRVPYPPIRPVTCAIGADHYGVEIWIAGSTKSWSVYVEQGGGVPLVALHGAGVDHARSRRQSRPSSPAWATGGSSGSAGDGSLDNGRPNLQRRCRQAAQ